MGFGRFSFTGMYPVMVHDGLLTVSGGSLAASSNYLGYLVGAVLLSRAHQRHAAVLSQVAMVGTILCLAALCVDLGLTYILAVRFFAGVFSALAMIMATTWLFHGVGYHRGAPVLFAGVGAGILASAELVAAAQGAGWSSAASWGLLAGVAGLSCTYAWYRVRRQANLSIVSAADIDAPAPEGEESMSPPVMILLYGLAGFGYIVTATYLPLFIRHALGSADPIQVWAAFGLGAVPSCFIWHALHRRLGSRRALILNLCVQASGVMLPVLSSSGPAFLASAVLVGGTFVGTVTIALSAARTLAARVRYNIVAAMTAAYGIGQIAGPLVSDILLSRTHTFVGPLVAAGGALLVALAACLLPRRALALPARQDSVMS